MAPFRNLKWKFQLNNVVSSIVFKKVISVLEINGRGRIEDKQWSLFPLTKWILKQTWLMEVGHWILSMFWKAGLWDYLYSENERWRQKLCCLPSWVNENSSDHVSLGRGRMCSCVGFFLECYVLQYHKKLSGGWLLCEYGIQIQLQIHRWYLNMWPRMGSPKPV